MASILNQELASDTDDEDFILQESQVPLSEEDSSSLESIDGNDQKNKKKKRRRQQNKQKVEDTIVIETEQDKEKRIAELWNNIKSSVAKNEDQRRKTSIKEYYTQKQNSKQSETFKFAGENYTISSTDLLDIKIKPKSKQQLQKKKRHNINDQNNPDDSNSSSFLSTIKASSTAPRMRKSRLEALAIKYGVSETVRLNTLEKSKLDWNKFVEEEGIRDELKRKNKDGYLERVAFLQRVDERQDEKIQSFKRKRVAESTTF